MASQKSAFMLFLLFSSIYAVNVDASFHSSGAVPQWHFDTDLSFTTDLTLSADADQVVDAVDPGNLQNGDTVCSGAVITALPTVTSKWAVTSLDVAGGYPVCGSQACSGMTDYATVNKNRDIAWLSSSVFDDQNDFGDNVQDFSHDPANYNALGTFETQSVTYAVTTLITSSGKEGGANVFCKGDLVVRDGSSEAGGSPYAMPAVPSGVDVALNSAGSHTISSMLTGVQCIAAMVKHPLSLSDPTKFWLTYYTRSQPTIFADDTADTITLNVQDSSGTCKMSDISITPSGSFDTDDAILITVRMRNDGDGIGSTTTDDIKVTGVASSNSDYTAFEATKDACDALGVSSSLCPKSSGFGSTIAEGDSKDLNVFITRSSGASGGTKLTFQASTASTACGGPQTCTREVDIGDNVPITCKISPSSLSLGTNEVGEFKVKCQNLDGDSISCVGSDWEWVGIEGKFISGEKDKKHAWAYPTSSAGTTGTMKYSSPPAECHSDVDVVPPGGPGVDYTCEMIPPSVDLNYSESQDFELNCWDNTAALKKPDTAEYNIWDGLDGSLSDKSTSGVTYTAPDDDTTGRIRVFAEFDNPPANKIGAVAFVDVSVTNNSNGGGEGCNETTDPGCSSIHNPDGSSGWCTIGGSGDLSVFPGYSSWVGIKCGPDANENCYDVEWSMIPIEPNGLATLYADNDNGTRFTITGEPGETVKIRAKIGGFSTHDCLKTLNIQEPWCWEYS